MASSQGTLAKCTLNDLEEMLVHHQEQQILLQKSLEDYKDLDAHREIISLLKSRTPELVKMGFMTKNSYGEGVLDDLCSQARKDKKNNLACEIGKQESLIKTLE